MRRELPIGSTVCSTVGTSFSLAKRVARLGNHLDNGISMEVAKIRAQLAAEREQNRAAAAERGRLAALAAAKRHKELSNSALAMRAPRPRFIAKECPI